MIYLYRWICFWNLEEKVALAAAAPHRRLRSFPSHRLEKFVGMYHTKSWSYPGVVPSGYVKIAIEHTPIIVSFPIKHGGSFHSYMLVYRRVPPKSSKSWMYDNVWECPFEYWNPFFNPYGDLGIPQKVGIERAGGVFAWPQGVFASLGSSRRCCEYNHQTRRISDHHGHTRLFIHGIVHDSPQNGRLALQGEEPFAAMEAQ